MKYFTATYVSQKTLYPAKLKALEVLKQEDPACCMMYKVQQVDQRICQRLERVESFKAQ